jgi:hypothetical protein
LLPGRSTGTSPNRYVAYRWRSRRSRLRSTAEVPDQGGLARRSLALVARTGTATVVCDASSASRSPGAVNSTPATFPVIGRSVVSSSRTAPRRGLKPQLLFLCTSAPPSRPCDTLSVHSTTYCHPSLDRPSPNEWYMRPLDPDKYAFRYNPSTIGPMTKIGLIDRHRGPLR